MFKVLIEFLDSLLEKQQQGRLNRGTAIISKGI